MTNTPSSSQSVTLSMLTRMEEKILPHRPQLRKIKEAFGTLSYFDYAKQKTRINLNKTYIERKHEVIDTIKAETSRLLGTAIASDVEKQLKKNDSISTAEHTSPIGTGQTLSAGLQHAIPMFNNPDPRFKNIIILSCSSVSFANELSFSRGLQFHLFPKDNVVDTNISFFGRSSDAESVMYSSPYSIEAVIEMKKKLETLQREGQLDENKKNSIDALLTTIYSSPHTFSANDFTDQLTITNYYFWKKLFPSIKENEVPNYIMLSQEKILLNLITKYHLDQDTPIHRLLFDTQYVDLLEKHFTDVTGAHSSDRTWGTFLFWGYSKEDKMRFQLFRNGNQLVNKEGTYTLELTPKAIAKAIANKEIFPGLLLTFIVLSFYYGLILGGGPSQTSYLTEMKRRYINMMKEAGDERSANDTEQSITDDFIFYRPHLAFLEHGDQRISATALDMFLYQDPSHWSEIVRATKSIAVSEFMNVLLPTLYKQFCNPDEREDELMNISRQDVEQFLGLDKKLPTLGVIA